MFLIGQNLRHVYMTYSFLELLIFLWFTLLDVNCLEFTSTTSKKYCMRIQTPKETNYERKAKRYTISLVSEFNFS